MMQWASLEKTAFHPLVLVASIGIGIGIGELMPEQTAWLGAMSDLYVRLLKMVVLPLVMAAIIYNLRRLLHRPQAGAFIWRTAAAFVVAMTLSALLGTASALWIKPGANLDADTQLALGQLIQAAGGVGGINEKLTLEEMPKEAPPTFFEMSVRHLVPENIFAALMRGENLKVVFFSLLFGIAAALVPGPGAEKLNGIAHTVFAATLALTRYFGLLLPPASLAMAAHQTATVGIKPLMAMPAFLEALGFATLLALALSFAVINLLGRDWRSALAGFHPPLFMAIATRNSFACLPKMMEGLTKTLRFDGVTVDVVAPLGTALARLGPAMFYAVATLFIAGIYGRTLTPAELVLLVAGSTLAGFASAGMSGMVIIYQTALVSDLFNLPLEAALVMFLLVEPVSDIFRTLVVVAGNMAIAAVASARSAPCPAT